MTRPTKADRRQMRREMHLTRPPRLEGKVKNAMMNPNKKARALTEKTGNAAKPQGWSERQRKDYQLKSRRRQ